MNKVSKTALLIAVTFFFTACSDNIDPPTTKYDGKKILQPITLFSARRIEKSSTYKLHGQRLNISSKCEYQIGGKKGRFTTPATIFVPLTDKKQKINFVCSHVTQKYTVKSRIPKATYNFPSIKLTNNVTFLSGWNRFSTKGVSGYIDDGPAGISIPSGKWADKQFKAAVEDHGVQTFPSSILLIMNGTWP